MSRKALHLVVDLEIQAVTCPGVWLCPNGNVQLVFSMLGQEIQTKRLPPVFPLLFHEMLMFQKTFPSAGCLAEVQDALGREDVYAVLLQEVDGPGGGAAVQLARFHSSALHILYPSPCAKGLLAGVDVDLLMEASADYPGILCPKIELSTKTVVKEVTSSVREGYIINPKTLSSQRIPSFGQNAEGDAKAISRGKHGVRSSNQIDHNRKVKHSQELPQNTRMHRVSPCQLQSRGSLINVSSHINGHQRGHSYCTGNSGLQKSTPDCHELCQCGTRHLASKCPLCKEYKAIFSLHSDSPDTIQDDIYGNLHSNICIRKRPMSPFETNTRLSKALHAHVDRVLEPTMSGILHGRDLNFHIPFTQSQSNCGLNLKKHSQEQQSNATEKSKKLSESDPCFKVSCGSGDEYMSHRQLFYANLEKFYRKLYDRAKNRAQEES